jgi:hypothetical protein
MNRARTYHCTRMRHCIEQSNGLVPSLLCPSWVDYIIATRGYDFRKGQERQQEKHIDNVSLHKSAKSCDRFADD